MLDETYVKALRAHAQREDARITNGDGGGYAREVMTLCDEYIALRQQHDNETIARDKPIPMVLHCSFCWLQHVDEEEWATKPHKTHLCARCKTEWRPANVYTVGVKELPK
jgi:hypothetical protein